MSAKARKLEHERPLGQSEIYSGIQSRKELGSLEKELLWRISIEITRFGVCKQTDGYWAKLLNVSRETINRAIKRLLEKVEPLKKDLYQVNYTKRKRTLRLKLRLLRKWLGLRLTFGNRSKKAKRHISTHFVRRKEKQETRNGPSAYLFALDCGCNPLILKKAVLFVQNWARRGQLLKDRIDYLRNELINQGANSDQLRAYDFECHIGKSTGIFK